MSPPPPPPCPAPPTPPAHPLLAAERLRRLDESIARALRSKTALVAELLGLAPDSFAHMADLAVADTLGQVGECSRPRPARAAGPRPDAPLLADVCGELRASRLSRGSSADDDAAPEAAAPDMHQLLLAAQAQGTWPRPEPPAAARGRSGRRRAATLTFAQPTS